MQNSSGKPPLDNEELLLARQLHQQGNLFDAAIIYRRILARNPLHADTLNLLGVLMREQGDLLGAEHLLRKAAKLKPNHPPIQTNLANILFDLKNFDDAILAFNRAIELEPENAKAYCNRGNFFVSQRKCVEALQDYNDALKYFPNDPDIYSGRGNALVNLERFAEALHNFDCAIELENDFAEAHFNKALLLLLKGEMRPGWQLYEWRWKTEQLRKAARNLSKPLWLGDKDLSDKTVLLWSEQGLGDTIQFCRYAELVKSRGARVLLEVPQPLFALLKELPGVDMLLDGRQHLPNFDYHCPLLSLPLAFDTKLATIPNHSAYLTANDLLRKKWAAKLGKKIKPRIGITWSGNSSHKNDHLRSVPLELLLTYLPARYEYFCLQKDMRHKDQELLKRNVIRRFGDQLTDFAETAALCDLMDLVISVDTSVAHLAGAIGKPTWILLPHIPDFRWLLDREDSPWYSSVRLFRQAAAGNWADVLKALEYELKQHFG